MEGEWYESDDRNQEFEDDYDEQSSSKISSTKTYSVLNKTEIVRRQDEEISQISSVLSLSRAEASVLLCHCNWKTSDLHDEWFANEDQLRTKAGLFTINNSQPSNNSSCGICFDDELSTDQVRSLGCDHVFCKTCWRGYIDNSINESGAGCLLLRCPQPKCPAAVGRDMVGELASKEAEKKYLHYFIRSYVEFKTMNVKWCPAPGCNNAIEIEPGCANNSYYDVTCDCSHVFCYNCGEEPHRPVECKIVREWILKNTSEAENTKWIMAYSKPCPKCKRPIEKKSGCNHMTCGAPCGHHFCWLCARTLGEPYYSCNCNGYSQRAPSETNDEERQVEMAKHDLERYAHYYERWASNNKSRDIALVDLNNTKSVKIHLLNDKFPWENLDFVIDAWEQIVECRRVLKWTYAYGFFLPEHEKGKQNMFDYLQGEAERSLERLHGCAEKELDGFIKYEGDIDDIEVKNKFNVFRAKLCNLTKTAGNYFSNLVKGLEKGLTEVWNESVSVAPSTREVEMQEVEYMEEEEEEEEFWACDRCSYRNSVATFTCEMCFDAD